MNRIRKFLPFANRKKKIVAEPRTVDRSLFYMEWTKAPLLKSQGAENYYLSSFALPFTNTSGPIPLNAKQLRTVTPSPSGEFARVVYSSVVKSDVVNGQIFAQPLYIPDQGGFGQTLNPVNAFPFPESVIAPAGAT